MKVLRRRAAAMYPREKRYVLLSVFGLVTLVLYYGPAVLYVTVLLGICTILCYYHNAEPFPARLGPNPRPGLTIPTVLRRWLRGSGASGTSAASPGSQRSREPGGRSSHTEVYRREGGVLRDSVLFSPRDLLMGSYVGRADSSSAGSGRPRAGRTLAPNPREQLRERLSRPNHAVCTPSRRLSFTGELPGPGGRFTITPQRHYPLQQPGVSSVGVLPPAQWDGFRKKNVLSPRNSPAVLSPVTVKIARPDATLSSTFLDHVVCTPGGPGPSADPCSRETVLKVLKESRKREVEDEERTFTAEQKSKRRRNDSGGSAHSAFEPLLPNGAASQLVPKPGSLKRGINSVVEESTTKRSRTSSISSSGDHAPRGTPGSVRNPIHSSYSSSHGFSQRKKTSAPSSPLSSPGSSRPQTPERASKKPREDEGQSPSVASSVRSDPAASSKAPATSKQTTVPQVPQTAASSNSTAGSGKRKRKIQLVSSHRADHISL
ncbi:nuclear envelope pore membrane protein POM 121, partial [Diretmus argenteus]